MKKKGFTLIELLVVVLIIGILAAISTVQYQGAIDKTRAQELLAHTKVLADSQTRHYMEHGKYSSTFSGLDVDIKCNDDWADTNSTCYFMKDGLSFKYMFLYADTNEVRIDVNNADQYNNSRLPASFQSYVANGNPNYSNMTCTASTARGRRICKSFGYTDNYAGDWWRKP